MRSFSYFEIKVESPKNYLLQLKCRRIFKIRKYTSAFKYFTREGVFGTVIRNYKTIASNFIHGMPNVSYGSIIPKYYLRK